MLSVIDFHSIWIIIRIIRHYFDYLGYIFPIYIHLRYLIFNTRPEVC